MDLRERRLRDIAPLRALGQIARELGVPLTLIGGTASRAAMRLSRRPRARLDLFDLVPFSSDIDLEYDADPTRGPDVRRAIEQRIPFASWFRWSLIDRDRAAKAAAQRAVSTYVPLRRIRFSTNRPADIGDEAMDDLEAGTVSFHRNPNFSVTPREGLMRDAEIFGLMMALNVEADFWAVDPSAPGLDANAALDWLRRDGGAELRRVAEDPRLRGRFWTLFATRWAHTGLRGRVFQALTALAGEAGVFRELGFDPTDETTPIGVSKLRKEGVFRAPRLTPTVLTGEGARTVFVGVMRDVFGSMGVNRRIASAEDVIDPALELVALAPSIQIENLPEERDENPPDPFESGIEDEFIQLSWPHGGTSKRGGFTAQLLPYGQRQLSGGFSSVPAVGGVEGDRAWIRARLDDLVEPDETGTVTAALLILQARNG